MRSGKPELDETKRQNTARRSGKTHQCAAATLHTAKRGGITPQRENVAAIPSYAERIGSTLRYRAANPNQTAQDAAAFHRIPTPSGKPGPSATSPHKAERQGRADQGVAAEPDKAQRQSPAPQNRAKRQARTAPDQAKRPDRP
jgi:hypothetical protein